MDPYELARQQGQILGQAQAGQHDLIDAEDLMDLLLQEYTRAGHLETATEADREAIGRFAQFSNDYLAENRVASTGVVDGGFALVFDTGQAVQLASSAPETPGRPEPTTVPITTPKNFKMKSMMPVVDNSVPMTTGDPHKARRPR